MLLSLALIAGGNEEPILEIGDKVWYKSTMMIAYIVNDKGELVFYDILKELIDDNIKDFARRSLIMYIQDTHPIVSNVLSEPIEYKCKFCDHVHEASIELYFPEIQKKFYIAGRHLVTDFTLHDEMKVRREMFINGQEPLSEDVN